MNLGLRFKLQTILIGTIVFQMVLSGVLMKPKSAFAQQSSDNATAMAVGEVLVDRFRLLFIDPGLCWVEGSATEMKKSITLSSGEEVDCSENQKFYDRLIAPDAEVAEVTNPGASRAAQNAAVCLPGQPHADPLSNPLGDLVIVGSPEDQIAQAASGTQEAAKKACDYSREGRVDLLSFECLGELTGGLVGDLGKFVSNMFSNENTVKEGCIDKIIGALWSSVKGLLDLSGMLLDAGVWAAKKVADYTGVSWLWGKVFGDAEDSASDIAGVAATASDEEDEKGIWNKITAAFSDMARAAYVAAVCTEYKKNDKGEFECAYEVQRADCLGCLEWKNMMCSIGGVALDLFLGTYLLKGAGAIGKAAAELGGSLGRGGARALLEAKRGVTISKVAGETAQKLSTAARLKRVGSGILKGAVGVPLQVGGKTLQIYAKGAEFIFVQAGRVVSFPLRPVKFTLKVAGKGISRVPGANGIVRWTRDLGAKVSSSVERRAQQVEARFERAARNLEVKLSGKSAKEARIDILKRSADRAAKAKQKMLRLEARGKKPVKEWSWRGKRQVDNPSNKQLEKQSKNFDIEANRAQKEYAAANRSYRNAKKDYIQEFAPNEWSSAARGLRDFPHITPNRARALATDYVKTFGTSNSTITSNEEFLNTVSKVLQSSGMPRKEAYRFFTKNRFFSRTDVSGRIQSQGIQPQDIRQALRKAYRKAPPRPEPRANSTSDDVKFNQEPVPAWKKVADDMIQEAEQRQAAQASARNAKPSSKPSSKSSASQKSSKKKAKNQRAKKSGGSGKPPGNRSAKDLRQSDDTKEMVEGLRRNGKNMASNTKASTVKADLEQMENMVIVMREKGLSQREIRNLLEAGSGGLGQNPQRFFQRNQQEVDDLIERIFRERPGPQSGSLGDPRINLRETPIRVDDQSVEALARRAQQASARAGNSAPRLNPEPKPAWKKVADDMIQEAEQRQAAQASARRTPARTSRQSSNQAQANRVQGRDRTVQQMRQDEAGAYRTIKEIRSSESLGRGMNDALSSSSSVIQRNLAQAQNIVVRLKAEGFSPGEVKALFSTPSRSGLGVKPNQFYSKQKALVDDVIDQVYRPVAPARAPPVARSTSTSRRPASNTSSSRALRDRSLAQMRANPSVKETIRGVRTNPRLGKKVKSPRSTKPTDITRNLNKLEEMISILKRQGFRAGEVRTLLRSGMRGLGRNSRIFYSRQTAEVDEMINRLYR